jgi:hypothetical protein
MIRFRFFNYIDDSKIDDKIKMKSFISEINQSFREKIEIIYKSLIFD